MSSISIKSAKDRYGGTTEAETIANMARAHHAYRVYKYANDYGDKVTQTDYKLVASDADEVALRSSDLVHNVLLVYDGGKAINIDTMPSPPSHDEPKSHEVGQNVARSHPEKPGTQTNWYIATSDAKHARQIVVHLPSEAQVPSRVEGSFVGPISRAAGRNWAAMTLFMTADAPDRKGPFVFAKANGVVEDLRGCPARVAFSFYRYRAGGLLQIFLHVHSPAVERKANSPYIVENGQWPDADDARKLVPALLTREHLEVCFLTGEVEYHGHFGLRVSIPADLRAALSEEWKALNEYHASLPTSVRSFQEAMSQFERENPIEATPILPEAAASPTPRPQGKLEKKPEVVKPWWKFWA